jgi:integrase
MPIPGEMIFETYRLDMKARGIKPHSFNTYDRVARLWQAYLRERGVAVADATRHDVLAFLVGTGWSASTQRTAKSYLSAAYEYAVDDEVIARNPCRRVRLPRAPQHVVRTIAADELARLWAQPLDADDRLLLALFMFTGLRTIEVRRLSWHDVDMRDGLLLVNGKGDRQRLVPIHPALRRLLVGRTWAHTSAYVAAGRAGDQVSTGGLHYRMQRIRGDGRNHDFRRTVATSLRANGCDPSVRDAVLGWSRDTIFDRHYNAVSPAELHRAILLLYADAPIR